MEKQTIQSQIQMIPDSTFIQNRKKIESDNVRLLSLRSLLVFCEFQEN